MFNPNMNSLLDNSVSNLTIANETKITAILTTECTQCNVFMKINQRQFKSLITIDFKYGNFCIISCTNYRMFSLQAVFSIYPDM